MSSIHLTRAPPAPGPAPPGPGQQLTKIRTAAATTIDRLESYTKQMLNLKATLEQMIRRIDRMQHRFDDVGVRFNAMEETLDMLGRKLKGMGEMHDRTAEACGNTVETLNCMDETLDGIVKMVCALEGKVEVTKNRVDEQIRGRALFYRIISQYFPNRICSIGLWPIRVFNSYHLLHKSLEWPAASGPPYPAERPNTFMELQSMDAEMCTALAASLGLPPFDRVQPLDQKRRKIIEYLGCLIQD
ncbi:hypothetical protein BDR04DRAFT_1149237 [Suillus decipiens]|nr:hypothetical protein BDR04DRAFT_1149237 [Suillus decipiens]